MAGEQVGCLAMSEPEAGSDVLSMKTAATKVAGGWELSGSKMWITNGPEADVMVIYARTGPGQRGAHTAFIVDGRKVGRGAKLDKLVRPPCVCM